MTQQIDLASLYRLREAGILPAGQFRRATWLVRDNDFWTGWSGHALLGLGLVHVLAGIICFFAFNWADMPPFVKFGVIAGAIVVSALSSWRISPHRPAGQALLICASVLSGVLLAVIGQVYQTGADAFQLFAAWALVILPWVLVSRSAAHWAVWVVIYYLAWSLYLVQVWLFLYPTALLELQTAGLATLVPLIALVLRELAVRAGADWLGGAWTRLAPLVLASGHLLYMGIGILLEDTGFPLLAIPAVMLLVAMAVYGRILPSFPAFAAAAAFLAVLITAVGWRIIALGFEYEAWSAADPYALLMLAMTLWCVGVAFGLQKLLRRVKPGIEGARP